MAIVLPVILGLSLGSFVNALVWRLRQQSQGHKNKELSVLSGRSMCPECKHILAWYDLLPVVSWISLAGKCRYCKKPIGYQYPLVELLTAALLTISFINWPYDWGLAAGVLFATWTIIVTLLMALTLYDVKYMLLPNVLLKPLYVVVAAYFVLDSVVGNTNSGELVSGLIGVVVLSGLFYGMFAVSDGKWIGGGDVKLVSALALLAGGIAESLLIVFLASLIGTMVSLPGIVGKRLKLTSRIPFGPMLILATLIVWLWGSDLLAWFSTNFLITV